MLTFDSLMQVASDADVIYQERVAMGFGPGTCDDTRNKARREYETAILAAAHMEQNGIEKANTIGSFCVLDIRKGDTVMLKAGAKYTNLGKGQLINKRNRKIKIHNFFPGYIGYDGTIRDAQISWAGSGGYWCDVSVNDIEVI